MFPCTFFFIQETDLLLSAWMFLNFVEIFNNDKAAVRRAIEYLVKKYLRDGCWFYFDFTVIKVFLQQQCFHVCC